MNCVYIIYRKGGGGGGGGEAFASIITSLFKVESCPSLQAHSSLQGRYGHAWSYHIYGELELSSEYAKVGAVVITT